MGISFKKIDAERKKIGMSITDFSKKVGISRKTYYDWENDVVPVLTKYLKPLEGVLGIDVKDIEDDKEKIPDAFLEGLNTDVNKSLKRVQWLFNYIIKENNLSNVKIAKILDISISSVDNYRGGKSIPKPETLAILQKVFKVSIDWIMNGNGSAFLNTDEAINEFYKQERYTGAPEVMPVNENSTAYKTSDVLFSSNQKINIEEAMGKTYKVLTAGTALSVALYMNIQQFATALDTGQALQICQDQMKAMQEQINTLNARHVGAGSEEKAM